MQSNIFFLALIGLGTMASGSRVPLPTPLSDLSFDGQPEVRPVTPQADPKTVEWFTNWGNMKASQVSTKQVDLCNCGQQSSGRIVGGTRASQGEFPWRVLVQTYFRENGSDYVGTCGDMDVTGITVLAGDVNKMRGKTIQVNGHAQAGYNSQTHQNDVALIRLKEPLDFTNPRIGPACLPYKWREQTEITGQVLASGWGDQFEGSKKGSDTMLKAVLDVIGNTRCKGLLKDVGFQEKLTDSQVCTLTPKKDTCQGDSGGSIDALSDGRFYAFGVVSFGIGCARRNSPGVYARVSEFIPWIESVTGEKYCRA